MRVTSSVACPHPLENYEFGHIPLLSITIPVGIFFDVSLAAHLCLVRGAYLADILKGPQYILWWRCMSRMYISFQQDSRRGGCKNPGQCCIGGWLIFSQFYPLLSIRVYRNFRLKYP